MKDAFDSKVQEARPYKGQILSAKIIRSLVSDSKLSASIDEKIKLSEILTCCEEKDEKLTLCFSKDKLFFRGIKIEGLYKWLKRDLHKYFKEENITCTIGDSPLKKEYHIILQCKDKNTICQLKELLKKNTVFEFITKRCLSDIQDAYSLRCAPQVHGAVFETIEFVKQILTIEINSIVDNPLIFPDTQQVISGGNFHGEPVGFAMDFLGIAVSELANISERRIFRLLDPKLNRGLPPFLVGAGAPGLHSGLMLTQYTAASLVSENKSLAHPATVDSIPTSANQEDHVSMSANAALKTQKIIENTKYVISIELLNAIQAIHLRARYVNKGPRELLSDSLVKILECISNKIKFPIEKDRIFKRDIEEIYSLLDELIEPFNPLSFI
ncbi:MAG: aromatic amino acid lyase [Candidatus Odinarchaeota archaeon]|nr:aromatic amino acid lyase [Candidatus Odinarchaeota archaeon]